jgi:hypothetical protein
MKKKIVLLGVLIVALGIFSWGCYTIVTHPTVESEEGKAYSQSGEYYREHCTDCHAEYHDYPYGFYYNYYPDYYWDYPRWGHYNIYPWWWDSYWWNNEPSPSGPESTPERVDKAERKRGMEPPYATPSVPYYNPPISKQEETPPVKVKTEENQNTKQEQEKKSEDKAERRRK